MIHQKGDLLWIPQAAMLYRGANSPMAVKLNDVPRVAVFLDETEYDDYVRILIDGQKWIVEKKQTRVMKEQPCLQG